MLMKTMVIGCGRWGTFIAWYLNYVKQEVILYGRKDSKNMHQLLKNRKNEYLELPLNITLSNELGEVMLYLFLLMRKDWKNYVRN